MWTQPYDYVLMCKVLIYKAYYIRGMNLKFKTGRLPKAAEICTLYDSAALIRPTDDPERITAMYKKSNLVITVWDGDTLVGSARSITDFRYCCYLADLAIKKEYQHLGIGKRLLAMTREAISEECMLLLLATPEAMDYYPKLGMEKVDNGFIYKRTR